jgi:DNA-binding NarL/FixJ family response regulator
MVKKTKVLIVDDHHIVVEGIRSTLEDYPQFEVAGTASDGLEAIAKVKSLSPDVVIMDISMPSVDGVGAAYEIKKSNETIRIIIYTMHSDKEFIVSLFRIGVSGYVLKDEPISDLILALKSVESGATYFSDAAQKVIRGHIEELEVGDVKKLEEGEKDLAKLSLREKEVFPLLADGKSVREIAERLYISPKTVETHRYHIMEKLKAKSIVDLTKIAIQKNLIRL